MHKLCVCKCVRVCLVVCEANRITESELCKRFCGVMWGKCYQFMLLKSAIYLCNQIQHTHPHTYADSAATMTVTFLTVRGNKRTRRGQEGTCVQGGFHSSFSCAVSTNFISFIFICPPTNIDRAHTHTQTWLWIIYEWDVTRPLSFWPQENQTR